MQQQTGAQHLGREDKPKLLEALELILEDPEEIRKSAKALERQYLDKYEGKKTLEQIQDLIVTHIIRNYSYYTAFVGGASGLTAVVPGIGSVIALVGGAGADVVLSLKWQTEMVMAIAVIYGHDITTEEEKRLCLIVTGIGALNEAGKQGGKQVGSKAFIKMTQQYLKGPSLVAVKELFKKIGVTFSRKALEKSIPFGVGAVLGFGVNKAVTSYVGSKARDFFKVA